MVTEASVQWEPCVRGWWALGLSYSLNTGMGGMGLTPMVLLLDSQIHIFRINLGDKFAQHTWLLFHPLLHMLSYLSLWQKSSAFICILNCIHSFIINESLFYQSCSPLSSCLVVLIILLEVGYRTQHKLHLIQNPRSCCPWSNTSWRLTVYHSLRLPGIKSPWTTWNYAFPANWNSNYYFLLGSQLP